MSGVTGSTRMRVAAAFAVAGCSACVAAGAASAPPPRSVTKVFEVRFSITYAYKWKTDRTVATGGGCKATYTGSGRAYAVIEGRSFWTYQEYVRSSPLLPAKPRNSVLRLERTGKLGATDVCPPGEGGTQVHQARDTGCGSRQARLRVEGGMLGGRGRGERRTRYSPTVWEIEDSRSGRAVTGDVWDSLDPCPPSYNEDTFVSFDRQGRPISFKSTDYRNPLFGRTILRARFLRRNWGPSYAGPIKAALGASGGYVTVGEHTTAMRFRVLFCAKKSGGCGKRKP